MAKRWRIARKFVAVLVLRVINIIAVNGPSTTSNCQQNVATVSSGSSPTKTNQNNNNNNTNHNHIGNGFYAVETILNMMIMFYHIRGFLANPLDFLEFWQQLTHYFFSVSFYIFTIWTLFASINICTGHQCSLNEEIIRTVCGFVFYITISLLTLEEAESDFHLMYQVIEHESEVEPPLHPFFEFMRAQAVCALTCGVTYLLHAIVVIDVSLSNEADCDFERMFDDSDEYSENFEYIPARPYLLGELVHTRLEQYEWFYNFARGAPLPI